MSKIGNWISSNFWIWSVLVFALMILCLRGCNMAWNHGAEENLSYKTASYAIWVNGHVEYTKFSDGSQDVKIYPGLGHRLFDSELHQDVDGDGKIDRIRQNGAEWKMNALNGILIRRDDYQSHKEQFDEADVLLKKLMKEYFSN